MTTFERRSKTLARVRWERGLPRLEIHEHYEPHIKRTLHVLTAIGVASSVVSLPWFASLPLSGGLVCLDRFLSRTLFIYTTMYVQPLPDFEYEPAKWESMAFLLPEDPDSGVTNAIGLVFNDESYAKRFFSLLRAWNDGETEDRRDNVRLSFITDEEEYYVFLYPDQGRRGPTDFNSRVRRANKLNKFGREHLGLVASLVICKSFSTMAGYGLGTFLDHQRAGDTFEVLPLLTGPDGLRPVREVAPIVKRHLKAKARVDLTKEDFERVVLDMRGV